MPLGDKPAGQVPTQLAVAGTKYWPDGQVTQVAAEPTHVAQLLLHAVHTLLAPTYVPVGQEATQALPLRYGSDPAALQLVHALGPAAAQARQLLSQATQLWPFE